MRAWWRSSMDDLIYVAVTVATFALLLVLVRGTERL